VPAPLESSGFADYVVPRFSLKTGIRISRVAQAEAAEMRFTAEGTPLFSGLGTQWALEHDGDPRAERFLDWLRSDVGKRTIESYQTPDGQVFSTVVRKAVVAVMPDYDGDADRGEALSLSLCGRCHVINEKNRMNGMGSTPSFAMLRSLRDWDDRFARFFLLNPHPAFTQIAEVSEPFDPSLPPPIVPMEMTQGDLDAIMAYVQGIAPADLGAPLHLQ
jgi:mono/diheme cytochrome c family protein